MRARASLLIAVFASLAPLASHARAPYTWAEAVDLSSRNNSELQAARETLKSVEHQQGSAQSGFYPQITASLGVSTGSSSVVTSVGGVTSLQGQGGSSDFNYSASLNGNLNLFRGLQDLGRSKQAAANARASEASLQIAKAKASYDLKSSYQSYLYAKEFATLTQDIIKRREYNLQLVELRFENGRENKGSVLLSKAYLAQAKYDDLQARNAVIVSQAQLARTLGLDDPEGLDVSDEIPTVDPGEAAPDFKALALQAPEHLQAQSQEESSEAAVVSSRSQFFPSLDLTGTLGRQGSEFFPQNERWSATLNLSFPLFTGMRDYHNLKSAVYSRASSTENRMNVDRQLLSKIKQAYSSFLEATALFKVNQSFKEATTVRAEIARNKYNNGLLTFEDWDVIESDLISRQKAYLQSKRDRVVSEAAWEQSQGKGVLP